MKNLCSLCSGVLICEKSEYVYCVFSALKLLLFSGRDHLFSGRISCMARQFDQGQAPLDCQRSPLDQGLVLQAVVEKILVGRVDAQRQCACLEEAEERPQLVVDHQGMALAAAGGSQQDWLVD